MAVAIQQMFELVTFRRVWASVRMLFQAEDRLFKAEILLKRRRGIRSIDLKIQVREIAFGAGRELNNVSHSWLRSPQRILLPVGPYLA